MAEADAPPSETPIVPQAAPAIPPVAAPAPVTAEPPAPADSPPAAVAPVPEAAAPAAPSQDAAAPVAPAVVAEAPKPVEAIVPAVEPAVVEAPVAPVYADFKMPEGFTVKPDQLTGFTERLGKYGLTQEAGQDLLEFGTAQIKFAVEDVRQQDRDAFMKMRQGWVRDVDKIFGKDRDEAVGNANWLLNEALTSKGERTKLFEALAFTGAGDNPLVIKALSNIAKRLKERSAPPASLGARAPKQSPEQRRYHKNGA